MIKVIRAIVAVAFCAGGVLAALHVGQAQRDGHRAAAERSAREAWLAAQPPSPWEQAAEAQRRWAAEAERHRPACRAQAEFLNALRPEIEHWLGDAGGGGTHIVDVGSFVPSPQVRRFVTGRRVLFAEVHGGVLRPSCNVCPSFASPARIAVGLPEQRLARTPDEAEALVIIARRSTPETDAPGSPWRLHYAVTVIGPDGPGPVGRYRFLHDPLPRHCGDSAPRGGVPDAVERSDRLSVFIKRLVDSPPD